MPNDADLLADRRKLRRKLTLWRGLSVFAGIVAVIGIGFALFGRSSLPGVGAHVARVTISGFITGDKRTLDLLERVSKGNASAVIVKIDSPGGSVSGAEALYDSLRKLAAAKPTVGVVDGLAASGGYIAALGTDRIVARQTAIVGSIGVIMQYPNLSKLMDTVGIKVEEIKSGPLKAAPNYFEQASPEARAAIQNVVNDTHGWFRSLVQQRRSLSEPELNTVADGRVHSGRQALALKLVDQIGSEEQAIDWLVAERKIPRRLPIRDWKPGNEADPLGLWSASARLARAAGFESVATIIQAAGRSESVRLDGLLALWQPPREN